jgi:hypothetical protein
MECVSGSFLEPFKVHTHQHFKSHIHTTVPHSIPWSRTAPLRVRMQVGWHWLTHTLIHCTQLISIWFWVDLILRNSGFRVLGRPNKHQRAFCSSHRGNARACRNSVRSNRMFWAVASRASYRHCRCHRPQRALLLLQWMSSMTDIMVSAV